MEIKSPIDHWPSGSRPLRLGLIALLCLFTHSGNAAAADSAATAAELKSTVERLNALDQWFSEAEQQRAIWLVELQRQDREIARVNLQVADIRTQVQETTSALEALQQHQLKLNEQRRTQARLIAEHVSAAYRLTGQDFLKQLLNQESPDTFARMIRYHRHFSESRLDVMAQYQATLAELENNNRKLVEQQAAQSSQQKELVGEQQTLASERSKRSALIDQLDAETESKTRDYEQLKKDRNRLEQLLAELRRRDTELDGSAFTAAKGTLPMPAAGPIRHAFGASRAGGRLRWHGIDIAAEQGAPVTAVFRGRIIFSDWLRGFGLLTIVDHGSDYMTLYGHADVLYKKVGDWVESGEVIAGAGNSGGTQDTGIYFEVRHKGDAKDPINWVAR
ncbi:MAG: murein hydrolase activator EnvC family protein [bacterium]